jgi:hypothetical protein
MHVCEPFTFIALAILSDHPSNSVPEIVGPQPLVNSTCLVNLNPEACAQTMGPLASVTTVRELKPATGEKAVLKSFLHRSRH